MENKTLDFGTIPYEEFLEITQEMVDKDRNDWNMACLQLGLPAISTDVSARLMAVVYVHGNNENMVFNKTFLADARYIQARFGLTGGGTPSQFFSELLKGYVRELEDYEDGRKGESASDTLYKSHIPQWAKDLFKDRYGIKLIN